jgi:hypothetical protein
MRAVSVADVSLGRAVLCWRRRQLLPGAEPNTNLVATSSCDLPVITVQRAPLVAELVAPLVACTGVPVQVQVLIENRTSRTETLALAVGRSASFAFAGLGETQCSVRSNSLRVRSAQLCKQGQTFVWSCQKHQSVANVLCLAPLPLCAYRCCRTALDRSIL